MTIKEILFESMEIRTLLLDAFSRLHNLEKELKQMQTTQEIRKNDKGRTHFWDPLILKDESAREIKHQEKT